MKFFYSGICFILSDDSVDLEKIIETTEALLKKEGFDRYEISSPIKWVGELDGIKDIRMKAQAIGGGFVGLLIVLIFGSIGFLSIGRIFLPRLCLKVLGFIPTT